MTTVTQQILPHCQYLGRATLREAYQLQGARWYNETCSFSVQNTNETS